jgi:hypothetical protein
MEYAKALPTNCFDELEKHSHKGSNFSSVAGIFTYRGVRAEKSTKNIVFGDLQYESNQKCSLKKIAMKILEIPKQHSKSIDTSLKEIEFFRTSVATTSEKSNRIVKLIQCIDEKLLLKKLITISLQCVDCELETMSVLQYELLHEMMLEEEEINTHIQSAQKSLKEVEKVGLKTPSTV